VRCGVPAVVRPQNVTDSPAARQHSPVPDARWSGIKHKVTLTCTRFAKDVRAPHGRRYIRASLPEFRSCRLPAHANSRTCQCPREQHRPGGDDEPVGFAGVADSVGGHQSSHATLRSAGIVEDTRFAPCWHPADILTVVGRG
jgi:hypothetical protein